MIDEQCTIVIDNGGYLMRAGFAGEDVPRLVFPTIIGQVNNRNEQEPSDGFGVDYFVGEAVREKKEQLILRNVLEQRKITSWNDMEKIWNFTFEEMKIDPSKTGGILLSEVPLNCKKDREMMAEIMFEKFKVPALYLASQAALSLFASGRTTGLVLDSGDTITHTVPVYEGSPLHHATMSLNFGGRDFTQSMVEMITKKGVSDSEIARSIKENHCYVALDYQEECRKSNESKQIIEKTYELPDGNRVTLDYERFQCPEMFFQPNLFHIESESVIETLCTTILKCDLDIRADFRANIVLSGGSTMFSGMDKRISKDLIQLFPEYKYKIKVAPPLGSNSAWIGGSLMASLSQFQNSWMTEEEYQEDGPSIIHRKFY